MWHRGGAGQPAKTPPLSASVPLHAAVKSAAPEAARALERAEQAAPVPVLHALAQRAAFLKQAPPRPAQLEAGLRADLLSPRPGLIQDGQIQPNPAPVLAAPTSSRSEPLGQTQPRQARPKPEEPKRAHGLPNWVRPKPAPSRVGYGPRAPNRVATEAQRAAVTRKPEAARNAAMTAPPPDARGDNARKVGAASRRVDFPRRQAAAPPPGSTVKRRCRS